ncbi:unnamed protein product [Cladocopium goreaui]|uniref:Uncharacterized protein n=1 Tax=Cladocopium goreaui TaxID=2562237 RepID=A0A9P1CWW2_9DINO|nr:unnamed protein product [Cladocopium goreaui]
MAVMSRASHAARESDAYCNASCAREFHGVAPWTRLVRHHRNHPRRPQLAAAIGEREIASFRPCRSPATME